MTPHVRPRPQARPRDHPDRRPGGVLVPAARAQARGRSHGVQGPLGAGAAARQARAAANTANERQDQLRGRLRRDRASRQGDPGRRRHAEPPRAAGPRGRRHGHPLHEIATGERDPAPPGRHAGAAPAPAGSGTAAPPVAAGGETAQSRPGGAVESANNARCAANQAAAAAEQSGVDSTDTQTSTSTGGLPIGGGEPTPPAPRRPPRLRRLETVPLEMEFIGNFFNLADFFHDIKRFVHVANNNVVVSGRLVTIEGVKLVQRRALFPRIRQRSRRPCTCRRRRRARPPARRRPVRLGHRTTPTARPATDDATPHLAPTATATP